MGSSKVAALKQMAAKLKLGPSQVSALIDEGTIVPSQVPGPDPSQDYYEFLVKVDMLPSKSMDEIPAMSDDGTAVLHVTVPAPLPKNPHPYEYYNTFQAKKPPPAEWVQQALKALASHEGWSLTKTAAWFDKGMITVKKPAPLDCDYDYQLSSHPAYNWAHNHDPKLANAVNLKVTCHVPIPAAASFQAKTWFMGKPVPTYTPDKKHDMWGFMSMHTECTVCGHPYGKHMSAGLHCPDGNPSGSPFDKLKWASTTFNGGPPCLLCGQAVTQHSEINQACQVSPAPFDNGGLIGPAVQDKSGYQPVGYVSPGGITMKHHTGMPTDTDPHLSQWVPDDVWDKAKVPKVPTTASEVWDASVKPGSVHVLPEETMQVSGYQPPTQTSVCLPSAHVVECHHPDCKKGMSKYGQPLWEQREFPIGGKGKIAAVDMAVHHTKVTGHQPEYIVCYYRSASPIDGLVITPEQEQLLKKLYSTEIIESAAMGIGAGVQTLTHMLGVPQKFVLGADGVKGVTYCEHGNDVQGHCHKCVMQKKFNALKTAKNNIDKISAAVDGITGSAAAVADEMTKMANAGTTPKPKLCKHGLSDGTCVQCWGVPSCPHGQSLSTGCIECWKLEHVGKVNVKAHMYDLYCCPHTFVPDTCQACYEETIKAKQAFNNMAADLFGTKPKKAKTNMGSHKCCGHCDPATDSHYAHGAGCSKPIPAAMADAILQKKQAIKDALKAKGHKPLPPDPFAFLDEGKVGYCTCNQENCEACHPLDDGTDDDDYCQHAMIVGTCTHVLCKVGNPNHLKCCCITSGPYIDGPSYDCPLHGYEASLLVKCEPCQGSGWFNSLKEVCEKCCGLGKVKPKHAKQTYHKDDKAITGSKAVYEFHKCCAACVEPDGHCSHGSMIPLAYQEKCDQPNKVKAAANAFKEKLAAKQKSPEAIQCPHGVWHEKGVVADCDGCKALVTQTEKMAGKCCPHGWGLSFIDMCHECTPVDDADTCVHDNGPDCTACKALALDEPGNTCPHGMADAGQCMKCFDEEMNG